MKKILTFVAMIALLVMFYLFNEVSTVSEQKVPSVPITTLKQQPKTIPIVPETANQNTNAETSKVNSINHKCLSPAESQKSFDEKNNLLDEYFANSESSEVHQMSAIIGTQHTSSEGEATEVELNNFKNERIDELSRAINDYPENKLINYQFVGACSMNPSNTNCSVDNINKAIKLDGSNGALWANVASIYISQNNIDAAINALEQSYTVPIFDNFRIQRILFFNDTIVQSGIIQNESVVVAMGYEAAISYYGADKVNNFCSQIPILRSDIAYACLDYGKRIEQDGSTFLSILLGLEYQRVAHTNLDDEATASKILTKKNLMIKRFKEATFDDSLMFLNNEYQDYWFHVMTNYNEIDAYAFLKEEVTRITSDPNYNPCPIN